MPAARGKNSKKRVNFALSAPEASRVNLAGTFNDWDPEAKPLRLDKEGVWRTWLSLPPGEYEYLFVVDDQWCEDPACPEQTENPYGSRNSVVRV